MEDFIDYPCTCCSKRFTNGEALIHHMMIAHTNKKKPSLPAPSDGFDVEEIGSNPLPSLIELQRNHTASETKREERPGDQS